MKRWMLCCALPMALNAAPTSWEEGARQILEAYDTGNPMPELALTKRDQAHRKWLEAAASQAMPANPYRRGSREWKEAEQVRSFLTAPPSLALLEKLPLSLEGSRMALWRWGKARVRQEILNQTLRRAWEDRLMKAPGDLIQTYATRHALCFSLAENDLRRFQAIQEQTPEEYRDVVELFQRAFPLVGGPCPPLRVWTLPDLESREQPLNELGPKGAWIAPLADFPAPPPAGWAWILPSPSGSMPGSEETLDGTSRREGETILKQLGRHPAFFAPSAEELGAVLPTFFPIRLDFDEKGRIRQILLGDAAKAPLP